MVDGWRSSSKCAGDERDGWRDVRRRIALGTDDEKPNGLHLQLSSDARKDGTVDVGVEGVRNRASTAGGSVRGFGEVVLLARLMKRETIFSYSFNGSRRGAAPGLTVSKMAGGWSSSWRCRCSDER